MKEFKLVMVLLAALVIVSAIGCAKPPAEEGAPSTQSNRNAAAQANANAGDLTSTPLYTSTLRGDVERAGLAVMEAHDSVKQQKWPDAVVHLRNAQSHIEKALERNPRLKDDFEAARMALLKTITSVESRGSDIEARFTEIQTRIGALKAYTSQQ
jgi:hypothetical protein